MIIGGLLAAFAIWLIFIGLMMQFDEGGHFFLSRIATAAGATLLVPIGFVGGFVVEMTSAAQPSLGRGLLYGLVGAGVAAWFAGHHWRRLRLDEVPGKPHIEPEAWDAPVVSAKPKPDSKPEPEREPRAYVKWGRPSCGVCRGDWSAKPGGMRLVAHRYFGDRWLHPECKTSMGEVFDAWDADGCPECDFCRGWPDGFPDMLEPISHPRTGKRVWLHSYCKESVVDRHCGSQSDLDQLSDPEESRIEELEERVRELEEQLRDDDE
jgi:hypothetical protein